MAKNSNTLFGASRSAVTKNIISSESVDGMVYGSASAGNQVKFAYGSIKSAGRGTYHFQRRGKPSCPHRFP